MYEGEVREGADEGEVSGREERAGAVESREEAGEVAVEEEGSESGSEVGGEALEGVAGWGGEGGDEAEAGVGADKVESKSLQALTLTLSLSLPSPPGSNLHHHYQLLFSKIIAGNLKSEEASVALINLLLKCTTHVSTGNFIGADTCLCLMSALASPSDDPFQHLSSHLASPLTTLLLRRPCPLLPATDFAFADALPYLLFVHAVTACTLLRSFANARHLDPLARLRLLGNSPPWC